MSDERGIRRSVSMTDVARRAGVSQKTVSRVVNDEPHVTEAVRARVRAAIEELGFRPNAAARALVTRRTRRIGVVALGAGFHGPSSVLEGVESVSRQNGYALSVIRTEPGGRTEIQAAVDALVSQGVEAIVVSEPVDFGEEPLTIPDSVGVLTFGMRPVSSHVDELVVGTDEFTGARDATEHLLALGHEAVFHIAGPDNWLSSRHRRAGWAAALEEAGVRVPGPFVGDWTPQGGYEAMMSLLARGECTAVFVANDQMSIGAIAAIERSGLTVPGDISVVGFDDIDVAAFLSVPLTTVRQDFAESSRLGVHRLIRAIDGHPPSETRRTVPAPLVIRASTGRPRRVG